MSMETDDYQEPVGLSSQKKYTTYFVLGLLAIIIMFALSMWWLDHQAVLQHERQFSEQQALQTFLAKQGFEDHLAWLVAEIGIIASHYLAELDQDTQDLSSLEHMLGTHQSAFPEIVAFVYLDTPDEIVVARAADTPAGNEARRVSLEWAAAYWPEGVTAGSGPFFPPFHITPDHQLVGMLVPVASTEKEPGLLVAAIDLYPLIERYVAPLRSGQYGAGYSIDGRGYIVYDHETEIIGRNIFDGMHANYPDLIRFDSRLVSEAAGQDEYTFTVQRGGQESRKLAAWNTVTLGNRKLVIVLSAPDIEFDEALADLRLQRTLFGLALALTLLGLSAIFFRFRQKLLEQTAKELRRRVRERTAELAASESRYRALVENAPLGVLSFDRGGNIVAVNSALLEILGSPSVEATRQINLFTFPLLVKAGWAQAFQQCLDRGDKVVIQRPYTSKWGKTTQLRSHFSPTRNSAGEVIGGQALVEDFTILKAAEDRLAEERNLLRTLIDNLPDSHVFVKDTESRFVDTNATHLRFFGVQTVEEIRGRTDFDFYPPELAGQFFADEQEIIRSGQPLLDREELNIDKAGNRKWVLTTKVALRDNQGNITGIVGMSRDITKYKRLESQLHQTQRLEAIGTLAGGIAHDFNNMLTAIMGYAGLTLEMLPGDSPVRSDIHGIQKTAERAANLTRQLLAFARRQMVEPKVIDLNELILNIDKMLRRLIGETIELVTLPDSVPCRVKADPHQIEQVLVNLAVNARDAMPTGGKLTVTTARVTLSLTEIHPIPELDPGRYVRLTVTDTGVGMNEEVRAHLFEPFFTTKEVGQGTGLGLATCFGIVKQSGGHILAHSRLGHGTSFQIYLPEVEPKSKPLLSRDHVEFLPKGTETILLVEDETAVRELAGRILREQGYTVLEAANGEEALRLFQKNEEKEIHLLLADVVMPQLGGLELAERLMVKQPDLKVLLISGYTNSTTLPYDLGSKNRIFLPKPFPPEALVRKVREVLDS